MKKIRFLTLFALVSVLILLALVGCKKENKVVSVHLKDHDPNSAIETAVGDFDYGAHTLVVTYDSGRTEEIALSADMIAPGDLFKFYEEGEHSVTASYGEQTFVFKIDVKRSTFKNLSFPENTVFTYDGKEHTVEVEGDIPANAIVTYSGGNCFVNVGTYDVTATVSCEGYVTARLSTTVKIEHASYDMSGVSFEPKEVVYDGNSHSVGISGVLPEGVSKPTYYINEKLSSSAVDVGEYKVIARFSNKDPNYKDIPDMETTLTITPAEYSVNGLDIIFKDSNGKVIQGGKKVYDGTVVTFDLNDYFKLSNKISVTFSVTDKNGNDISHSNKLTNILNAGVYTAKVDLKHADSKNYKPIEPITRTFEIEKTSYTIDNVTMDSDDLDYDGNPHFLKIKGTLPDDVKVSYEYYLKDVLVRDAYGEPVQSVVDAGRYTVKAVFTHTDENRGKIEDVTATLNIKKINADLSMVGFFGVQSIEYDGQSHIPEFVTWKEATGSDYDLLNYGTVEYYVLGGDGKYVKMEANALPTEIGSYKCVISISIAEEYERNYFFVNGKTDDELSFRYEIKKKTLTEPQVTFNGDGTVEYSGNKHEIGYSSTADSNLMTVSTAYFKQDGNEYIPLGDGEAPIGAGKYKFVVTVSAKDTDYWEFSNGESSVAFAFEFEIEKKVINVKALFDNTTHPTYSANNMDLAKKAYDDLDAEIKQYFDCTVWYVAEWNGMSWEQTSNVAVYPGYYCAQYTLTVRDRENVILSNGSAMSTTIMFMYYFYIE